MKSDIFKIHSVKWDGKDTAEEVVLEYIDMGKHTTLVSKANLLSQLQESLDRTRPEKKQYRTYESIDGFKPVVWLQKLNEAETDIYNSFASEQNKKIDAELKILEGGDK